MSSGFAPLKSFVQRVERIQKDIDDYNQDKKEVYAEAKATGFDVKTMKLLIAERRKEPQALAEQSELLDLYRAAMDGTDVATPAPARKSRPRPAQPLTPHDPETGEIEQHTERGSFLSRWEKVIQTIPINSGDSADTKSCGRDEGIAVQAESTLAGMAAPSPAAETSADQGTTVYAESDDEHVVASQPVVEPGPQDKARYGSARVVSGIIPETSEFHPSKWPDENPNPLPLQVHRTVEGKPLTPAIDPTDLEAVTLARRNLTPDIPDFLKRATVQQAGRA